MDKFIQYYFILNSSDGNLNITECDKNRSLHTLAQTQTSKTAKYPTLVDCSQKIKHQTRIKINIFHNHVVSLCIPNK